MPRPVKERGGLFSRKAVDTAPGLFASLGEGDSSPLAPLPAAVESAAPRQPPSARATQVTSETSRELSKHGKVFCHQDMLKTNRFGTALIYVSRDFGVDLLHEVIGLKLTDDAGHTLWISGVKVICPCHHNFGTVPHTPPACFSYGLSPFLWNSLPGVPDTYRVVDVLANAQKAPCVVDISLTFARHEHPALPLVRNALRTTVVSPGAKGQMVLHDAAVYNYTVGEVRGVEGPLEIGFVDPMSALRVHIKKTSPEAAAAEGVLSGFARVGGHEHAKELLKRCLLTPLSHPSRFVGRDGKLRGVRPAKGILLYGVPGTGKSLLCRAIEEELQRIWRTSEDSVARNVRVERISSASIREAGDMETVFERARDRFVAEAEMTLLVIDEIDALCPTRTEHTTDERIGIINCLLSHLDGALSCWSTFVLATTNRPEAIDEALRRPGRLDKEVELLVPSVEDRVAILLKILEYYGYSVAAANREELRAVCLQASGFVPSDIENWVRETAESFPEAKELSAAQLAETVRRVRPSALKEFTVEMPKVLWEDIGGYESVKRLLQESVEWPVKYKQEFAALELKPPKGILLYGPPGNSKTLMAKAVATHSCMNFIAVKGPELLSKYVGESERKVRELFKRARQYAPTIIFFDEIDSIAVDRARSDSTAGVEARVLSQLLNEMDGVAAGADVVVLGATNRPDAIDAALLRPGRFDRLVYVALPDYEARARIWAVYLPHLSAEEHETLAEKSEGFSGAEIEQVAQASKFAVFRAFVAAERCEPASPDQLSVTCATVLAQLRSAQPRTKLSLIEYYENFETLTN